VSLKISIYLCREPVENTSTFQEKYNMIMI